MAVLDKPSEAVNQYFCSEQISNGCEFVHAHQIGYVQINIDDMSCADSIWESNSNFTSSCYSEHDSSFTLCDVGELINETNHLAESLSVTNFLNYD